MLGIIFAILSGAAMSLQGVLNTRLGSKIGLWETNVIVQASGLLLTLIICFFFGKGDFKEIRDVSKIYLLGGALGVVIIFTVMISIGSMGPTTGTAIILISQLIGAAIIDYFGLFGSEKIKFSLNEFIGVAIMLLGIIVFKWKH